MRTNPILASFSVTTLFLCASAFSGESRVSSPEGLRLFHNMQEALGGADKIAAVRDFEQQVRAESWNGNTGQSIGEVVKRTRWVRPTDLRVDQVGPGSTYVLYFDGRSGWEILPGTRAVVDLSGGELAFAQKYIRDFKLNTWLADRNSSYRITSPTPHVVRIADGDITHQLDITLDSVSSLPAKITSISLSDPAHPTRSDEVTTEWETVQGLRFARRWAVFRNGVRVAEATVERTTVNGGLKQSDLAAKPPDLRPVLSSRQLNPEVAWVRYLGPVTPGATWRMSNTAYRLLAPASTSTPPAAATPATRAFPSSL